MGTRSGNPPECGPEFKFGPHTASLNFEQGLDVEFTAPHNLMTIRYAFQNGEAGFNSQPMQPFVARPYTLIMHPKGTRIRCRIERQKAEFICVTFDDAVFEEHVRRTGIEDLASRSNVLLQHKELKFIALAMRRQIVSRDLSAPMFREMLPNLMLAIALNGEDVHMTPRQELTDRQIRDTLDFIQDNLGESLSIKMLAEQLDMSLTPFSKAFKATIGQSPYQYIFERRIDKARYMLAHGKADLAEISSACGFSSQAHMTSTFTKHLGVTPGRYRRDMGS